MAIERTCFWCKQMFYSDLEDQEYCSRDCETAVPRNKRYQSSKPFLSLSCVYCGKTFTTKQENQKFCSKRCSGTANQIKQLETKRLFLEQRGLRDIYVYGWYRTGERLPCYIGQGSGDRGFRCFDDNNELFAQITSIRIFCDGLSRTEASNTEMVMIEMATLGGGCAWNKAPGVQLYPLNWEEPATTPTPEGVRQSEPRVFVRHGELTQTPLR